MLKFKKNSFRYNLRLRLSVVTGVKMMYHHYASTKAEELTKIRRQINDANAVPSTNSTPVFIGTVLSYNILVVSV
jgi:hypothetical protein